MSSSIERKRARSRKTLYRVLGYVSLFVAGILLSQGQYAAMTFAIFFYLGFMMQQIHWGVKEHE